MKGREDLQKMAARGDLRSLVEAMGHPQPYMRMAASDILASQGQNALPILIEALAHENPDDARERRGPWA
jgi:hypothetical protein